MTTMKELRAKGALVSDVPVRKEITFKLDGSDDITAVIHVKKLSVGDHENLFLTGTDDKNRTCKLIAETITLGNDGKEKITFKDAYQLHPALAGAMLAAFNEVNGAKKP
ncbi:phage tail assembly chaperone family protein, TAC [Luteimonas saliphila]|uniref:phage tail assembly chaperone family protein, TAC n=1 Tax=Luteimonas saliphila TaxID=2804919 RepID=UPI00192DC214|nr:phage tail assembly chaperone family protein, TAC [Luteimonas saliphila]